jgi:hypothetical protein
MSAGSAKADGGHQFRPHSTSVTWPSVTPPGWYTNTYHHAWYYPWYANYNFAHGPYANWMVGGGYAGYANHGPAGMQYSHKPPAQPYIGDWLPRVQAWNAKIAELKAGGGGAGGGAFETLQGLSGPPAYPLPQPRELPDVNPKKDGGKK